MDDTENFEGEELDIEPYDGEPDFPASQGNEVGDQDAAPDTHPEPEADMPTEALGFLSRVDYGIHTWRETLEWYRENETASEIGFNPDGMCLMVCRTARRIGPRYSSAKISQDATPKEHRIHKVRDLRRGMVGYFDDPHDSNKFGHIATMVGRVKGFDKDKLSDTLWRTNSVKSGELVVVRGDYFERYWGDEFKFGATWLNGAELDVPNHGTKVERFHETGPRYNLSILAKAAKHRPRPQRALDQIRTLVNQLPDSPKMHRVREFKQQVRSENILDLRILDEAVAAGRTGRVKRIRAEILHVIESLPEE